MPRYYEITVLDQPTGKPKQRWPVRPSKRTRYFARRGGPRWNFWDLGLVSTGPASSQWTMLNFQPSACPFGTSSSEFTTTYTQELLDKIFEIPVELWNTYYKKIVPEMNYKLEVSTKSVSTGGSIGTTLEVLGNSNANFSDRGLRIDPLWLTGGEYIPGIGLDGRGYTAFRATRFGSRSGTANKVTTSYDITAPAVDFFPAHKMDVFLVPSLPMVLAQHQFIAGGVENLQQLDAFFWLFDRNIFLTPSHALYGWNGTTSFFDDVAALGSYNNNLSEEGNTTLHGRYVTGYNWIRDRINGARGQYALSSIPPYTSSDSDGLGFEVPAYNYDPGGTDSIRYVEANLSGTTIQNVNGFFTGAPDSDHQTLLRCVIKQNGTTYYIWNDVYA